MFRTLLSRRAREDARVDDFLHAIALSARYRVDPDWQLLAAPADDSPQPVEDAVALPAGLLPLLVPVPRVAG